MLAIAVNFMTPLHNGVKLTGRSSLSKRSARNFVCSSMATDVNPTFKTSLRLELILVLHPVEDGTVLGDAFCHSTRLHVIRRCKPLNQLAARAL